MKHKATRDLYAYWNALRGERAAPDRNDIEPTAIRDVLADTFMLELDAAAEFPMRLAGTRVNGLFNAEQKGRPFLHLWRPEERRNVAAVLMTVADGAVPVVAGGAAAPFGQAEAGAFEFLFLPLRHGGKTHARVLGMVTPTCGARPAWLGLLPPGPMALRSLRIVEAGEADERKPRPGTKGGSTASAAVAALAPTGSLLLGDAQLASRRPTLRLIHGGRPC